MKDFNYYAPTQVVFGRESEEQVAVLVNATPHSDQRSEKQYGGTKVLVHYGGKSSRDYTATCGGLKTLKAEDMEAIYRMARG